MSQSVSLLTLQFLAWTSNHPRSYADVKQAWQSTCPLNSAWEDAFSDGLIEFACGNERMSDATIVALTTKGRVVLAAYESQSSPLPRARAG